jgi:4-oxalocrotonate tautomerase
MPHIIVKLYPGRSELQKAQFTEEIVKSITATLKCDAQSVSVDFEEVGSDDWTKKVYRPDIEANWDRLTKKPGYTPL